MFLKKSRYFAGTSVEGIRDDFGNPLQIIGTHMLIDFYFDIANSNQYTVNYYYTSQMGSKSATAPYLYAVSGSPFKTITIEQPTLNYVRITDTHNGSTKITEFHYMENEGDWKLTEGNGMKKIQRYEYDNLPGVFRSEMYEVLASDDSIVYQRKETFREMPWGKELIETVEDPLGVNLVTKYRYYDDPSSDGNSYGFLKMKIDPSGYWEKYYYRNVNVYKTVSQYMDNGPETDEKENKVTLTDQISGTLSRTREFLLGQEISRRYEWLREHANWDIVCTKPLVYCIV